jgi:hypothetical protein
MIAYVKILDAEKRQKAQLRKCSSRDSSKESEKDSVEEITECLTSELRYKTSYQMVGELLRNNSHIAKQIGNYLKNVSVLDSKLGRNLQDNSQPISPEDSPMFEKSFELMVYDFE